jgi:hypothetical protein
MRNEIVVIRFGRMGDFIVSLPALLHIRISNPDAKITLITGVVRKSVINNKLKLYSESVRFPWVEIFREKIFDNVVYLAGLASFKTIQKFIFSIAGSKVNKVYYLGDYGEQQFKGFIKKLLLYIFTFGRFTWKTRKPLGQRQSRSSLVAWECLNAVGFSGDIDHLTNGLAEILNGRNGVQSLNFEINKIKNSARKLICIYPSSTYLHKRWSAEKFAELIRWIVFDGYSVVLVGHQGEYEINESVLQKAGCDNVVNLAGKTSFMDLIDLMDSVSMVIGNDGGVMHVAAMRGVPNITIMSGIYSENIWDPFGKKSLTVRFPTECSNCKNEYFCPNGTSRCVSEISVETVKAHFKKLIQSD